MSIYIPSYLPEECRVLVEENQHFGLIRDQSEVAFKAAHPFTLPESAFPSVAYSRLPKSQGVADWLKVEDQFQIGSCQGNARTSAEELAIYRATGQVLQLSRMFAYLTSQRVDNIRGDNGSTISGGAEASEKYGSCLELLFPYPSRYTSVIPEACFADGLTRKLTGYQALPDYDAVMRWLYYGMGGIVIGIGWNQYCEPDSQGRIYNYRSGGGGHALALLDWNADYVDNGKPFIEMYNSWSKRWGFQGRAYIAPKVVDYWCKNETVIGLSDMTGDGVYPRSIPSWRL